MEQFKLGQKVREKGKRQVVEVVGAPGLASVGVGGAVVVTRSVSDKTLCR